MPVKVLSYRGHKIVKLILFCWKIQILDERSANAAQSWYPQSPEHTINLVFHPVMESTAIQNY